MDKIIDRLRGHLQNCVNHLEMAKRNSYGKKYDAYNQCIQQANNVLYETLEARTKPEQDEKSEND